MDINNYTQEIELRAKGIYLISHIDTELKYVGSTYCRYGFKGRWLSHLNGFLRNVGNRILINISKKYGIEGFRFSILEKIDDRKLLPKRELFWINSLNTYNSGCNLSLNTENPLVDFKRMPLSQEHKEKLKIISKTRKRVYLYTFEGDIIKEFDSSCDCDRHFNLKKGRTSYIISNISNQKTLNKVFIPSYLKIDKKDWHFQYGSTPESRKKAGDKHKGKIISPETRNKMRLSTLKSIKVKLFYLSGEYYKTFNSLNECDDYLKLTRGATSKVLKGKANTLRRKFIPKIIS